MSVFISTYPTSSPFGYAHQHQPTYQRCGPTTGACYSRYAPHQQRRTGFTFFDDDEDEGEQDIFSLFAPARPSARQVEAYYRRQQAEEDQRRRQHLALAALHQQQLERERERERERRRARLAQLQRQKQEKEYIRNLIQAKLHAQEQERQERQRRLVEEERRRQQQQQYATPQHFLEQVFGPLSSAQDDEDVDMSDIPAASDFEEAMQDFLGGLFGFERQPQHGSVKQSKKEGKQKEREQQPSCIVSSPTPTLEKQAEQPKPSTSAHTITPAFLAPPPAPAPARAPTQPTQPTEQEEQILLFHPFSADLARDSSGINADDIEVRYDASKREVTVSGLWPTSTASSSGSVVSAGSSAVGSGSSSSSSKRKRAARKAHVRDVDENGDEILLPEDSISGDEDGAESEEGGFVKLPTLNSHDNGKKVETISKTVNLPEGVKESDLRAD